MGLDGGGGGCGGENVLTVLRAVGISDQRTVGKAVPQRRSTFAYFPCWRMNLFHVPSQGKIRTHPS